MKVAVYHRESAPLSYALYAENVARELGALGVEVVDFGTHGAPLPPCDVVWSPRPGLRRLLPLLARRAAPLVVTIHDARVHALPLCELEAGLAARARLAADAALLSLSWRVWGRRVAGVIAVSECARREIAAAYPIPAAKIEVVPHGVAPAIFHERRDGDPPPPARPYLLHVSASEPARKNLARILEAHARMPVAERPEFVLLLAAEHARAVTGAAPDVRVIAGPVPATEVADLYRGALALVAPSLHEGFGLPIIEAMACGCPVIASTAGACPEVAGDAALLVDPRSTDAIADAMVRLAWDAALRADLRAKGLARAAGYTWRASAIGHERVFRGLIAAAGRGASAQGASR